MSFPYTDTESWLGFGCRDGTEWAYVGFTAIPNLVHEVSRDGYDLIRARTRWGDRILRMEFSQAWGSPFIQFEWDSMAIALLEARQSAVLELPWYGQDSVIFRYSLEGSAGTIQEARAECTSIDAERLEPQRCAEWNTPEYFAAASVEDVIACLQAGSDPNTRNEFNNTALHNAARYGSLPGVVEALLDAGADRNATNNSGQTPLDLVRENDALERYFVKWYLQRP